MGPVKFNSNNPDVSVAESMKPQKSLWKDGLVKQVT